MNTPSIEQVKAEVRAMLAESSGISEQRLFDGNQTLASMLEQSDSMVNSIDVMEAFARISNRLKRKYAVDVVIEGMSLDDKLTEIMEQFVAQFSRAQEINSCR